MRRAFHLLRSPALLAVPCAGVAGRMTRCQNEPDAEPAPEHAPSAPPPDSRPPPFSPDSSAGAVHAYLQSQAGRSMVESVVRQIIRTSLSEESQRAVAELRRVRTSEQGQFRQHVKREADEAAQAAAHSEVQRLRSLVESVASAEVRKEVERVVPSVLRDDPQMKKLLKENLSRVRAEVHSAAEKELAEICDEDKYHRVNRAFLASLEQRSTDTIRQIREEAARASQDSKKPGFAHAMAATALVTAGIALFKTSKL